MLALTAVSVRTACVETSAANEQRWSISNRPGQPKFGRLADCRPLSCLAKRGDYYGTWTGYPYVETVDYKEGTLSVDLVDAKKKQLVWQGVAEGEVSEQAQQNPGPAIDTVVAKIFSNFPLPPQ